MKETTEICAAGLVSNTDFGNTASHTSDTHVHTIQNLFFSGFEPDKITPQSTKTLKAEDKKTTCGKYE